MAHVLTLYDGTTTLPLSTTNVLLQNYTPLSPEAVDPGAGFRDSEGEWLGDAFYRNVTETAELYIYASSKANLQTATRAIESMVERAARRRATGRGTRIYVQFQVDGDATTWRSELLAGRLVLSENAMALYANVAFEARLMITRRPFWEAATETELELSSNGYAASTGGRLITNTANSNWVQIAAAQIAGSIPSALHLDVANITADTQGLHTLWAVVNGYAGTAVDMYMTGSEAQGGSGAVVGSGVLRWFLDDSLPDDCMGGYVHVFAYMSAYTVGATLRGGLEIISTGVDPNIWWGTPVDLDADSEIVDLGVFPMPPGAASAGYIDMSFALSTTHSITVHHMEFIPVSSERRYLLVADGFSLGQNEAVVDDGPNNEVYAQYADNTKTSTVLPRGGPLFLNPGIAHRIVILWKRGTSIAQTGYTAAVRVWQRARRLTI